MGRAIANYWKTKTADRLRVFSPMFEEDEIPMTVLFRKYKAMPEIEGKALDMATGKTLDVGAGAGCHSLVLQEKGIDVTAIDISPLGTINAAIPKEWFDLSYDEFLECVITLAAAKHYGFTSDDLKVKKGLKEFFGFENK